MTHKYKPIENDILTATASMIVVMENKIEVIENNLEVIQLEMDRMKEVCKAGNNIIKEVKRQWPK